MIFWFSPIQQARHIDVSISEFQKHAFENFQLSWCFLIFLLPFYGDVNFDKLKSPQNGNLKKRIIHLSRNIIHMTYINIRVNYCSLRWIAWKRETSLEVVIRSKQSHNTASRSVFLYPRTVNSDSILFSWHKNFGGVIKRHSYHPWRKVSHGWDKQWTWANFQIILALR